MERRPDSHKGENGKIAVIGGSRTMHGAPIFTALAAEASGVDLIYLCIPMCHREVATNASNNFQVHPFEFDELNTTDTENILELLATMDSAVIGPGISRTPEAFSAIETIVAGASCPLVLDASALEENTLKMIKGKEAVLTPHLGEMERMGLTQEDASEIAQQDGTVFFLKGPVDTLISPENSETIEGGNAGLTVGGTGDVLAGLIGGLIAQGIDRVIATKTAGRIVKRAGEILFQEKGYSYTAMDVIELIPHSLSTLDD